MSLFQPRHYRFLARSFKRALDQQLFATDRQIVWEVIETIINDFAREDPNFFSRKRFLDSMTEGRED